ncbi:MAG: ABC transporter ATP-binding protein [Oscillatoriales cyanobacterium RU_3_3]|nr:ABC transporter ATP-binding protein [Oscillatoriales cyanobacterium RU_3_3]
MTNFFAENKITSIILVASSVILISIIKGIFTYSQVFISSRIGFSLAHKLRAELFSHLQRLSLSFHKRSETGDLLTKVTADTNNFTRHIFRICPDFRNRNNYAGRDGRHYVFGQLETRFNSFSDFPDFSGNFDLPISRHPRIRPQTTQS